MQIPAFPASFNNTPPVTSTQRILFGVVGSVLLVLGFVKAAELFDPVFFGGRLPGAADDRGGNTA
jgi:hypothetical protein